MSTDLVELESKAIYVPTRAVYICPSRVELGHTYFPRRRVIGEHIKAKKVLVIPHIRNDILGQIKLTDKLYDEALAEALDKRLYSDLYNYPIGRVGGMNAHYAVRRNGENHGTMVRPENMTDKERSEKAAEWRRKAQTLLDNADKLEQLNALVTNQE